MKGQPLAYRMRPKKLEDFYGQKDVVGENKLLTRLIKADKLRSLILFGPPGLGKTTLASIIANNTSSIFYEINATTASKKDMQQIIEKTKKENEKAVLFIDEIHRFNKLQQDYLLPFVEDGTIILIGATTENPYFEVNKALVSRSILIELKPLKDNDIINILKKAIIKEEGLKTHNIKIKEETLDFIASNSSGDARVALNILELAALTTRKKDNKTVLTNEIIKDCIQKKFLRYDKDSIEHHNIVSAFIKSMRGSDPQATNYYLACMLEAGEDINFIARRIIICASEDVGLADNKALEVAINAATAVKMLGMPEARIPLSQAATYIALAPKSNTAYNAINSAMKYVEKNGIDEIPLHIRYKNNNYIYPHDYKNHFETSQEYLPEKVKNEKFFNIEEQGYEKILKNYHNNIGNNKI